MPTATCALAALAETIKSPSNTAYFKYLIVDLRVGPAMPFPAPPPTSDLPPKRSFDSLKQFMTSTIARVVPKVSVRRADNNN